MDAVLTTRELARLIRMRGIDLRQTGAGKQPTRRFGERTTAGKIFGATGGVMEAAIRTAHYLLTGKELDRPERQGRPRLRQGSRRPTWRSTDCELGVAVVNGVGNVNRLLDEIRDGRDDLHFIEVMTCPGGCIAGGGQPIGIDRSAV